MEISALTNKMHAVRPLQFSKGLEACTLGSEEKVGILEHFNAGRLK